MGGVVVGIVSVETGAVVRGAAAVETGVRTGALTVVAGRGVTAPPILDNGVLVGVVLSKGAVPIGAVAIGTACGARTAC